MSSKFEVIVCNHNSMLVKVSKLKELWDLSKHQARVSKKLRLRSATAAAGKKNFEHVMRFEILKKSTRGDITGFKFTIDSVEGRKLEASEVSLRIKTAVKIVELAVDSETDNKVYAGFNLFKSNVKHRHLFIWIEFQTDDMKLTQYEGGIITTPVFGQVGKEGDEGAECFVSGIGLDYTFIVDSKPIKAPKFTLVTKSPVFKAMFENDNWKDSRENRTTIEDCSFEAKDTFIRAIHGVPVEICSVVQALELLAIADKYQVTNLVKSALCLSTH